MRTPFRWMACIAVLSTFAIACDLSVVDPAEIFVTPANGEVSTDDTPYLEWFSQTAATSYQIQVDDDTAFDSPEVFATTSATSHTVADPLPPGTYHWRIRALQRGTWSTWSQSWSFTVEVPPPPPETPLLQFPTDGSSSTEVPAGLLWQEAEGALSYRVQLDDDSAFGSPQFDESSADASHPLSEPLATGTYYWRVRAGNEGGDSEWTPAWSFTVETTGPTTGGLGVIGASKADEYRANDNRGGAYAETTFNWVELLVHFRDVDVGPWGDWGGPRRTGYEYNWARSGATAASAISSGQHTGLGQQIADDRVTDVIVDIGGNDFRPSVYGDIYDGSLSGDALQQKIDDFVEGVAEIIDTLFGAGSPRVLLALVADLGLDPAIVQQYPDADGRQAYTDAVLAANAGLRALAQEHAIPVWDPNEFAQTEVLARLTEDGTIDVGGEPIEIQERGNEPHHAALDDSRGHAGTVLSGLYANSMYLETFSDFYGLDLNPFSDAEILEAAGID